MKERQLGLLGRKLGMTRIFNQQGESLGVTVVEVGPCIVLNKLTQKTNKLGESLGYNALQLGFLGAPKPARKLTKAEKGNLQAVGGEEKACRFVRELRVPAAILEQYTVGQVLTLQDLQLAIGALLDITGITKGKGFQGVMKRHHFSGFDASHGTHEYFRHGGSIGCRKWPGRVFKGRKMPGQMGNKQVTTQNLEIAQILEGQNVLLILGSVPGGKNAYLTIRPAIKAKAN